MAETIYTDKQRGVIAYATSAKVSVSIGGVQLSDDVLGINFTGSVAGTFDTETGIAEIPIAPGAQIVNQYDIAGRLTAGVGVLENFQVLDLDNDLTPSDVTLLGQRTGGGTELVRVDVGNLPTGGGGEANLGTNVGVGFGVFEAKIGVTLRFHSINPLGILEGALNAQSIDLDFKDTASGNIVGRVLGGSGKPTFLIPSESQSIILGDNNGRDLAQQYPDAPAQFTTDFTFSEATSGRRLIQINPSGTTVKMTLPDAATITGQDGWLCDVRVASGAFASSVDVAVTGQMEAQNGYGSFDPNQDEQFFGLSQATAISNIYSLYVRGGKYNWQAGFFRNNAADDLTFDGPLQVVTIAGAAPTLNNTDHAGRMVEFTNAGAVVVAVGGLSGIGEGVEIHKPTVAGDVTFTGGVNAPTLTAGNGGLIRVRSDGVYVGV